MSPRHSGRALSSQHRSSLVPLLVPCLLAHVKSTNRQRVKGTPALVSSDSRPLYKCTANHALQHSCLLQVNSHLKEHSSNPTLLHLNGTLHLNRQQSDCLIMNSLATGPVFTSMNQPSNTQSADYLGSHLPLKKRLIRDTTPHFRMAQPAAVHWPLVPAPLHLLSTPNETNFKPISPSSFSYCSFASLASDTSVDSGFGEVEPLDLSCNSTSSSPKKLTRPSTTSPSQITSISNSSPSTVPKEGLMCPECGKVYESNSRFRAHLRRHESKRSGRYRCGVCSKNFVQRSSLKTHERIHTGERPYCCELCDQRFGDFSTFTKHRRTHTGEKPYACSYCGRGFSQVGNRYRHERTHLSRSLETSSP